MKRTKKLIYLLTTFTLVTGAYFAAKAFNPENNLIQEDEGIEVVALDANTISQLSWTYNDEEIILSKKNEKWLYANDESFPLNQTFPQNMLDIVSTLSASKIIESPDDLSQYGLDEPNCMIECVAGDQEVSIAIGSENSLSNEYYLSIGDGHVYLVDPNLLSAFSYDLYDLIEMETLPLISKVQKFTVHSKVQDMTIEYLENSGLVYSDNYVWFMNSKDGKKALDNELTTSYMSPITSLSWTSCIDYNASPDELISYGLDEPALTVSIDYLETSEIDTGKTDENGNVITEEKETPAKFTLEIGNYTDAQCYARLADSSMVYLIDAAIADSLLYTSYEELRPDDICLMDWKDLTGFDILLDGKSYSIIQSSEKVTDEDGNQETQVVYTYNDSKLDSVTVETLLNSISSLSSTSSITSVPNNLSEKISFVFYLDQENFSEMPLTFYNYDSNNALVSFNGEQRLLVSNSALANLITSAEALVKD